MSSDTERERIAYDLLSLFGGSVIALSKRAKEDDPKAAARVLWQLQEAVVAYCETDLGVVHPGSEEPAGDWRARLVAGGWEAHYLDDTHNLNGVSRAKAKAERERYAELMAPRIAQRALDYMHGRGGS